MRIWSLIITSCLGNKNCIMGGNWSDDSNWRIIAVKIFKSASIVKWKEKLIKACASAGVLFQTFERFGRIVTTIDNRIG